MVESVNRLFRSGIAFNWSIVIDGDKRDIDELLRQTIEPSLLQNCSITTLDKRYGPSFARNFGVKSLDCEFICWLDADDAINTQSFIVVFNELSSKEKSFCNKYDLVYTDSYDCDLHLKVMSIRKKKFIHDLHCKYKNTEIDPLLGVDFVYQMQFIRKEIFLSIGGFDEQRILGEDVDLILRISEKSRNVNFFHIPIPVYYYRDNIDGRCNIKWEELKYQMERVYLESSRRQNFPFREYRYIGEFGLYKKIFRHIKDNDHFSDNSLYDIYLPIDESNQIIHRPYIKGGTNDNKELSARVAQLMVK
ncbi:glycosyltransferase family 2 protein [Patescibacteria group bacterium]|nr:glycosyltransferase family 2 protein [Patescibacteria group bacterium]